MTLREWRILHKLTQAQFGAMVGVKARTVRRWETGKVIPSDPTKLLIARVTNGAVPISVWFLQEAA